MFRNHYWIPFAIVICVYLLWSAEHLTGPKDKLKRIWRNRVSTQKENTTMLRSTSNRTTASKQENYKSPINKEEINLLKRGPYEKCDNIYVDLGSNIGVQIRKLFEPLKYPKSKILNSYNDILGDVVTRRESVCAFGFEANPRHFKRLRQVQDIYNALGWKTTFYNRVVWTENNDTMTIYSDDENRNEDWGAGVFEVPTVDIASWFESIIDQYSPKTVMVKMDIEGSEYKVIPHLLRRNMLCADKISFMYMEFHNWAANGQLLNRNIVREQMASQNCVSTLFIHVDDETYLHDGMEFPTTGQTNRDIDVSGAPPNPRPNSHGINICKKAVCVKTHPFVGIGHRITNMLQGKLMSLALKLPLGTPNLEIGNRKGEKYAGLNDLFPLSEHIVDCSSQDTSTDWRVESLDFTLKKGSVFDLKSKTIQKLRMHANKAACNTMFTVKEFWPKDYEATFPWLRNIFTIGMQSTAAKNIIKNSVYDKSRFNIAIHFRNGDITPTPPAYFQAVIRELLTDLKPLTMLPIDITIFSENFAELPNKLRKIATESGLNVRVKTNKELSAVATMVHFGLADIFIASDSSMGWIPTWIAGNTSNPVVIAAPSTGSAQTWTTGTIRSDIKGTYDDREKIISKANSEKSTLTVPRIDKKNSSAQGASMGPIKESHDGDLIIADIFLDTKNETIAIVNSKRNVWTYKRHVKRAWTCKDIQTGLVVNGKVLPIETHGHSMVVSFGKQFVEGVQIQVSNGISEYEVRTLKRSLLNGRQFNLVAAIFISKELDQIGILERWVDWHSSMGVEHTLVYVNRKYDQPERLYMRFPNNVTFIPFWFNHDISFGDQQVQNMHALYTLKGVSKWMLSTDVDEYIICQNSLLKMLKGQSPIAFQLSSYTVDNDGHISDRPQYGSDLKGKVILNTDLATGHSVHMVTDANGGRPYKSDMVKGNHFNVSPDVCRIAHFKRTVEVTRQIENVSEQVYPEHTYIKL